MDDSLQQAISLASSHQSRKFSSTVKEKLRTLKEQPLEVLK